MVLDRRHMARYGRQLRKAVAQRILCLLVIEWVVCVLIVHSNHHAVDGAVLSKLASSFASSNSEGWSFIKSAGVSYVSIEDSGDLLLTGGIDSSIVHHAFAVLAMLQSFSTLAFAWKAYFAHPRNQRVGASGYTSQLEVVLCNDDNMPTLLPMRLELAIERFEDMGWITTNGKFVAIVNLLGNVIVPGCVVYGDVGLLFTIGVSNAA